MSLFFRRKAGPDKAAEERAMALQFGQHRIPMGGSFAEVDTSTVEGPLQSIAVRSAVDLLAATVSELPVEVFTGAGPTARKVPSPGYLADPAGDGNGLPDWTYQLVESWLLRGNAYGDVLNRSATGYPTQVLWQHPDEVSPYPGPNGEILWSVNGRDMPAARMLHRRVNPLPGRVLGLSPVALHARSIGLSLTGLQFGLQWFRDGAHPGGMLTYEGELNPTVAATAKDRFLSALRGNREPVVLGRGWKYAPIQVAPEESQFLETQGYSAAECARIFGPGVAELLGYESGGSLTYATVEGRSTHLLVYTLSKWLSRVERVLTDMLPRPQYAVINRDALLASTTLDRFNAHALALSNGWMSINEVRAIEGLPPVPGGDEVTKPAAPAPPAPDDGPPPEEDAPDE